MAGVKRAPLLLACAAAIWAICATAEGVALLVASEKAALAAQAAAAPIAAALVSAVYFGRFGPSSPVPTALAVLAMVMAMETAEALVLRGNLDVFRSFVATWLPLALIFAQVLASAVLARRSEPPKAAS